ncbi:hypothetical protein TYRP_014117 [Tyrophagus putrescentiae]|nr:hypothetical protein TYRP_014117 [Tyrophagus putrescentiae]
MSDTTATTSLLVIPVFWSLSNGSKRVVDILASSFCISFSSTGITTTANAVDYSASLERKSSKTLAKLGLEPAKPRRLLGTALDEAPPSPGLSPGM